MTGPSSRRCPRCEAANPAGHAFCGSCGLELGPGPVPSPPSPTPAKPPFELRPRYVYATAVVTVVALLCVVCVLWRPRTDSGPQPQRSVLDWRERERNARRECAERPANGGRSRSHHRHETANAGGHHYRVRRIPGSPRWAAIVAGQGSSREAIQHRLGGNETTSGRKGTALAGSHRRADRECRHQGVARDTESGDERPGRCPHGRQLADRLPHRAVAGCARDREEVGDQEQHGGGETACEKWTDRRHHGHLRVDPRVPPLVRGGGICRRSLSAADATAGRTRRSSRRATRATLSTGVARAADFIVGTCGSGGWPLANP